MAGQAGVRGRLTSAAALCGLALSCTPGVSLGPVSSSGNPSGAVGTAPTSAIDTGSGGSTKLQAKDTLQLLAGSEAIRARPVVQLIASPASGQAAALQAFLDAWAGSAALAAQVEEYGITALSVAPLLRSSYAWPPAASDAAPLAGSGAASDVEALLTAALDTGSAQPADGNTVAVVLVPAGISVALSGQPSSDACAEGVLAWHAAMQLPASNVVLPYVVVPSCSPLAGLDADQTASFALSHALMNALTNPSQASFGALGGGQAAWQKVLGSAEVASLCQLLLYQNKALLARPADLPLPVHRSWSNQRALSGQSPCVPAIAGEVFTMAQPQGLKALSTVSPAGTLGLSIGAGQTLSVPVKLLAEGGVASSIAVSAQELGTSDLTMAWSHPSGQAGDLLALTLALKAAPSASEYLVRLTSSLGASSFSQYLLLAVGGDL